MLGNIAKFIFGPCLDNSAVVGQRRRHAHPSSAMQQRQPQRQYQSQRQYQPKSQLGHAVREIKPKRLMHFSPKAKRLNLAPKSKRWVDPPQNSTHQIDPNTNSENYSENYQCRDNANGIDRRKSRNNSGLRSHNASNGGHQPKSLPRHNYNGEHSDNNTTSVHDRRRRYRRDDALNMSASLIETYRGCSSDDQTEYYLDEQSVIRRSFKESSTHQKNKQYQVKGKMSARTPPQQYATQRNNHERQRCDPPDALSTAHKSEFENGIEKMNKLQSSRIPEVDDDNVTTISKASINPYRVLRISRKASSRELYTTYEMRLKEAEQSGASDRAFRDVGNAYRRIHAEMKRQEIAREARRKADRREEEKMQQQRNMQRRQSYLEDEESDGAKTRRECIDARLKDHRELVQGLFANDNSRRKTNHKHDISSNSSVSSRGHVTTLQHSVECQEHALAEMNLVPVEAGALNINEQNQTIQNSCFYLSLAASYLSGVGAFVKDPTTVAAKNQIATLENEEKQHTMKLALQLKRAIEAAVLLVHPDWATSGVVGEEVQAFSDFLVYALDSDSILSHWTIAVFDDESGFVDIYRGRHYGKIYPPTKRTMAGQRSRRDNEKVQKSTTSYKWKYKDCDRNTKRTNTLTLRYTTGHYQPLLPELTKIQKKNREREGDSGRSKGLTERPALEEILSTLEKWNVLHVVTDGRADFNTR